MKRFLFAAALAAVTTPAFATDVGVSVSIGQPGFYGRLDIGNFPRPRLIYAEPMIIEPVPVGVVRRPAYLHVPPGHAKNWRKHCHKYGACGQPVYFVDEGWYNDVYAPRYREQAPVRHVGARDDRLVEYRGDYRDDRRDYRDDRRGRDDDRGRGKGRGDDHGKGNGKGRGHDR